MKDKTTPILSVIVPAYNAEKTLRRCIDSLLTQGDAPIEIILSNDGSTDNTQQIINEYVQTHPNVSSVYGDNGGLSCARNRGIAKASGQWITFVDSDDYVAHNIYSRIIRILTEHEPDILDYQYWVSTNGEHYNAPLNSLPKDTLLDHNWIENTILPAALNLRDQKDFFIENFVWQKVYRACIIHAHSVLFDETRRKWEDRLFTLTFLQYAKTYYSMSDYGYYYVCGTGQTLSGKFEPDILHIIMDSYHKYRQMYGSRYDFDNPYTTNYFCNLLIDVAKDQFAHAVDSSVLKNMLSIFVNDAQVKTLFANSDITQVDKQHVITIIRNGNIDEVYTALRNYSAAVQRKVKKQQGIARIRHLFSRAKQVILHEK
jgi:glycosyltransferase involved in cell wall biosynthesis